MQTLVARWLKGTVFWGFSYANNYKLLADRGDAQPSPDDAQHDWTLKIPRCLELDMRSDWWIGNREEWDAAALQFSDRMGEGMLKDPYMALRLRTLMYATVTAAELQPDGQLEIQTSDGDHIYIPGHTSLDDYFSWSLSPSGDDPEFVDWSITSDVCGGLLAVWRGEDREG